MIYPKIACGIDDNYVYPYLISILSAQKNSTQQIDFLLAYERASLSLESLKLIREVCDFFAMRLTLNEIELPENLIVDSYISRIAYSKLYIADHIKEDFVWLDADTLSISNIDELLREDKKIVDSPITARQDLNSSRKGSQNKARKVAGARYFNSGVLKFNYEKWNSGGFSTSWKSAARNYKKLGFELHDQCILNYITKGVYNELPRQLNILVNHEQIQEGSSILHYADSNKPWKSPLVDIDLAEHLLVPGQVKYLEFEFFVLNALFGNPELQAKFLEIRSKCDSEASTKIHALSLRGKIHKELAFIKWKILRFAAKRLGHFEFSAVDFNNVEKRRKEISNYLGEMLNFTVKYGPFHGLKLKKKTTWSRLDLGAMLLGLYEQPVVKYICDISSKHQIRNFIDLGAADGYYAVGMAASGLVTKSFAYEANQESQKVILDVVRLNGVDGQVTVRGFADSNFVDDFSPAELEQAVILIDIEGGEFELVKNLDLETLNQSFLVIELHDFSIRNSSDAIARLLFKIMKTHKVQILPTGSRNPNDFVELRDLHDSDRWLLCSEGRQTVMNWLCCEPREMFSRN